MQLTTEQLAIWKRDGIIVVPNVFSPEIIAPALEEIERNAYDGLTYTEYQAKWGPQPDALKSAYQKNSDMQRLAGPFGKAVHFPTGLEAVDKLIENEAYLAIAKQLLDTEEIGSVMGKSSFAKVSPIAVIASIRGRVTTLTMRRTHPCHHTLIGNATDMF